MRKKMYTICIEGDFVKLTVKKILEICNGSLLCGNDQLVLESFSKDTRTIQKGDCYVGIKGENFDGNTFWQDAIKRGAFACLLDSFQGKIEENPNYTIILVEDSVKALQDLATYVREQLDIPVIAITGSVGKTSTKDMIAAVLEEKYKVLKSPGNLNGQIGLPLNILSYKDEEAIVLEMGMNDFGQIEKLSLIAKPTIAVITNIGTAHIGILGSRENILKAKLEILTGMKEQTPLVINQDNDLLEKVHLKDHPIVGCSINKEAIVEATNIEVTKGKTFFEVSYNNEKEKIELPLMGEIFVSNALLAIAVGSLLEIPLDKIKHGLESLNTEQNHMKFFHLKNAITLIDDSYNSNLEAVESALKTLLKYPGKRHVAVLGDILEMEDYAKEIHQKIGSLKEILELDALFLQGKEVQYIKEKALEKNMNPQKIFYFEDQESLKMNLQSFLQEGDVVLVKASNGMHFHLIVDFLKEMNENIKEKVRKKKDLW